MTTILRPAPRSLLRLLLCCIGALTLAQITLVVVQESIKPQPLPFGNVFSLFDFDTEQNLPSLYSTLQLALASIGLSMLALESRSLRSHETRHWWLLAIVFALLALDESCSIHERTVKPLRESFGFDGPLYFAWVVPAMVAVTAFGALLFRFWWRLPVKSRLRFAVAGAVYICGALGVEMICGVIVSGGEVQSLAYAIAVTCEELMEMLGIAAFVFSIAELLQQRLSGFAIDFGAIRAAQPVDSKELIADALLARSEASRGSPRPAARRRADHSTTAAPADAA